MYEYCDDWKGLYNGYYGLFIIVDIFKGLLLQMSVCLRVGQRRDNVFCKKSLSEGLETIYGMIQQAWGAFGVLSKYNESWGFVNHCRSYTYNRLARSRRMLHNFALLPLTSNHRRNALRVRLVRLVFQQGISPFSCSDG